MFAHPRAAYRLVWIPLRVAAAVAVATVAALLIGVGPAAAHHGSYACVGACARSILFDRQFARAGEGSAPSGQPSEEWDGTAAAPIP